MDSFSQPFVSSLSDLVALPDIRLATMRPIYLASSAWLEHIPFAFWLIHAHRPEVVVELGTHYGCSYFSFCQAIERLNLGTRCYAVDHWKGDEHAGLYGEDVFAAVNAHNSELYSRFSRLVRSTFDEAAQHFPIKSIDLLHIDGHHSFESVQHDFEIWRPLLSDRAILILHDTNVRERGFGVSKMMEFLRKEHPVFEFNHGHGLGVIGIGKIQNPELQSFFAATNDINANRNISEFFSRVGRSCADAQSVRKLQSNKMVGGTTEVASTAATGLI